MEAADRPPDLDDDDDPDLWDPDDAIANPDDVVDRIDVAADVILRVGRLARWGTPPTRTGPRRWSSTSTAP